MDEVDKIIILSLKEIGCDIDDEVESLKQFPTELVVEAAARCIEAIQPGSGIPTSLPPSMSVRFRIGALIAQACSDLGYTGEVGYQTFLYSNESDLRRVLMFLIERLPKDGHSEKVLQEPSGKAETLRKDISAAVRKQLQEPWVPSFCRYDGVRWHQDGSFSKEGGKCSAFISTPLQTGNTVHSCTPQEWREYCIRYLPLVSDQVEAANRLIPSLITLNSRGILATSQLQKEQLSADQRQERADLLLSEMERFTSAEIAQISLETSRKTDSRFGLSQRLQFAPDKSPEKKKLLPVESIVSEENARAEADKKKREEEEAVVEKLKEENEGVKLHIEQLQLEIKTLSAKLPKTLEESDAVERCLKESEAQQAVRRKVLELLPDAEVNIEKLQRVIETTTQKLVNLASQWEKHRAPLLQQHREARKLHSSRASESARQAEALRTTREKVVELTEELKNKEELYTQLQSEYAKVSKDISSRSAYTRRIMEIIGNISKQKDEIEKVLKDTRELHKEINSLAGKLDRSFTFADELIFRDAKRDDVSRRAYKLLATLHSECGEIVKMVEETGANVRECRDLEDQIDTESTKNVSANLERISADLRQMKQETEALSAQLKNKSN